MVGILRRNYFLNTLLKEMQDRSVGTIRKQIQNYLIEKIIY
jgi:hypothetical protein